MNIGWRTYYNINNIKCIICGNNKIDKIDFKNKLKIKLKPYLINECTNLIVLPKTTEGWYYLSNVEWKKIYENISFDLHLLAENNLRIIGLCNLEFSIGIIINKFNINDIKNAKHNLKSDKYIETPIRMFNIINMELEYVKLQDVKYLCATYSWNDANIKNQKINKNYKKLNIKGLDWEIPNHAQLIIEEITNIARKMNFIFVWVDCICIKQEIINGKLRAIEEDIIAEMGNIYSMANASALISLPFNINIYRNLNKTNKTENLTCRCLTSGIKHHKACNIDTDIGLLAISFIEELKEKSSWINRLWTVQELILSFDILINVDSNIISLWNIINLADSFKDGSLMMDFSRSNHFNTKPTLLSFYGTIENSLNIMQSISTVKGRKSTFTNDYTIGILGLIDQPLNIRK